MEKIMHLVHILNEQDKLLITQENEKLICDTVYAVLDSERINYPCELTVKLINNNKIRYLNRKMRGISHATDVLSFPSGDDVDEDIELSGYYYLGDLAISVERAEKQRILYGHAFERELAFLTAHSVLHLLGYDHMTQAEEVDMFQRQEDILTGLGITR